MKNYISASSVLLVTAMMVTLSFGCGDGTGGDTGYAEAGQMQTTDGTCTSITATALGAAQECFRSGCEPGVGACVEVTGALTEFFANDVCASAAVNDELNGLPSGNPADHKPDGPKEGELKHIGVVICSAILDCGLCPALPPTFCPGIC